MKPMVQFFSKISELIFCLNRDAILLVTRQVFTYSSPLVILWFVEKGEESINWKTFIIQKLVFFKVLGRS